MLCGPYDVWNRHEIEALLATWLMASNPMTFGERRF